MIDTREICREIRRSATCLSRVRVHQNDEFLLREHLKNIIENVAVLEQ